MMQVKVGDRVRRVSHPHRKPRSPMVVGSEWTVSEVDDETGWFFVEGYDQLLSVKYFKLVPLDPSKVKAGDTVTLKIHDPEMAPFEVQGPAYDGPEGVMAGAWPLVGHPHVTLTDHQPAPEPEPEWEHHGIYKATVRGESEVTVMYEDPKDHQPWKSLTGIGDAGYLWHAVDQVTDVRPLVVIDPTRAKDALTRTGISDGWRDTVLEALGIES